MYTLWTGGRYVDGGPRAKFGVFMMGVFFQPRTEHLSGAASKRRRSAQSFRETGKQEGSTAHESSCNIYNLRVSFKQDFCLGIFAFYTLFYTERA